ncbi:MAG TPA: saccharopine dehydrogenase C-terminal domain-containing protein [Thermoanaerobaculia bacterium]|jgi:lysine 6-dehydrogenase|nr:saccharopine dehydrogenase C-terminal domain-containing protein [Thermoanaerobaculia bacterium]
MLVLGAGRMGFGAVYDLAAQPDVEEVTVADVDPMRAREVAERVKHGSVRPVHLDAHDHEAVVGLMRGHAATISCVNYWLNEQLARAAIEAQSNFCDLGGNNDVVAKELQLDGEARAAGVNVIPDCGLAPGMVAVLVAHATSRFDKLEAIHIRVGGLPQNPKPPLDYQLVFSVEGLINEYVESARIIRDGKIVTVASMTEVETLEFPKPFGKMEAFQTSGGTSTLPETFFGRVKDLDYKTIRYPGHCAKFKAMIDLGLFSSEPIKVDGMSFVPRRVFGELLVQNLPADEPDVVLVRVEVKDRKKRLRYDIIDRYDPSTGLSAMMRTTAFPASIVALMMARGQTSEKGALPQERCIPPALFMEELKRRNIRVEEAWI